MTRLVFGPGGRSSGVLQILSDPSERTPLSSGEPEGRSWWKTSREFGPAREGRSYPQIR